MIGTISQTSSISSTICIFVFKLQQQQLCTIKSIIQLQMSPPSHHSHFFLWIVLLNVLCHLNCSATSSVGAGGGLLTPPKKNHHQRQLSVNFYAKTCPSLNQLVGSVTSQQFRDSPVVGPATIRLFFHDCFVDGCDGSILISTKPGGVMAERDAVENKNLANEAFESINKAKALVESKCPGVVSCADILAISARDFVHLAGGPYYEVKVGRWDGKLSMATRIRSNLPRANSTMSELISLFSSKGLTVEDLVILSGAHTIGFAHCEHFVTRLYNYKGTKKADPSVDPRLLKALKMSCPNFGGNSDIVAPFDVTTPFVFDQAYYSNLESNLGVLATDQALYSDPRSMSLVKNLAKDKQKFFQEFALAMEKMGTIGVKKGKRHGEKRKDCSIHA